MSVESMASAHYPDPECNKGEGSRILCFTQNDANRESVLSPVNFKELFGNGNPVEIEIGCGKGKFLIARAQENPGINFLGLDRVDKWMKVGRERAGKRNLGNLFFLRTEVREWLERVPSQSVSLFHIYFPDPWPKRRHHFRRIISPEFLKCLEQKLVEGGIVELATDDADYFEQMKNSVLSTNELWKSIRIEKNRRLKDPHLKTNYELKYEAEGRVLNYMEMVKI